MAAPVVPPGSLGIGIQLPVQAVSPVFAEPWEHDAGPEELADVARLADEVGLLYVGVCDHVVIPGDRTESMGAVWYDPLVTLGHLAAVTRRVRLLTHVLQLGLRHPLLTAKAVATLDRLSGGRVILGVGVGHVAGEFDALRVPFEARGRRLDEAIDAVRAALSADVAHHTGAAFGFGGVAVAPRPVQAEVPIWVGGSSAAALRRVGERGDGWLPQGSRLHELPHQYAQIRERREQAGRGQPHDLGAMARPMYLGDPDWDVGPATLTGTGDDLADRILAYHDAGADHVQIRLRSRTHAELVEQLERVGETLLPALRNRCDVAG